MEQTHIKPINRVAKQKRRPLKSAPSLSCGDYNFSYAPPKPVKLPESPQAQEGVEKKSAA